ncbi:hypothetical protein HMPREF9162_0440 [Selenomonas sp. oral taxon 137 str. F0430]|nr:hypothetical protein HMPREF9162_0440 [Selenomonas sp. oral taxon 137 str. F0430]
MFRIFRAATESVQQILSSAAKVSRAAFHFCPRYVIMILISTAAGGDWS